MGRCCPVVFLHDLRTKVRARCARVGDDCTAMAARRQAQERIQRGRLSFIGTE